VLRGILPLRQCAGVGLGGKLVAESGLILVLSHGEAPSCIIDGQYRIRLQRLTIQFSRPASAVDLLF
jgi:hypothetical protein